MDNFSIHSTPTGATTVTRSSSNITIKFIIGFPAAILRGMIEVIKFFGRTIIPTESGTYIIRPVPGEDSIIGVRHVQKER